MDGLAMLLQELRERHMRLNERNPFRNADILKSSHMKQAPERPGNVVRLPPGMDDFIQTTQISQHRCERRRTSSKES